MGPLRCEAPRISRRKLAIAVMVAVSGVVTPLAAQTTPPAQTFGGATTTITGYRSTVLPDGTKVIGFALTPQPSLSGCAINGWFGFSFFIRSTQGNFKTLAATIMTALVTGRSVAGTTFAGCGGLNGGYQVWELGAQQ